MRTILQTLAAVSGLQRGLRSTKVQMRVDQARVEGKPIGGRPRGNNQVDESEVLLAVAEGNSIASVAKRNGIARSTVRLIVARGWALSNDERLELILACQVAVDHESKVVQRLESPEKFRTLPRREIAESIASRHQLIAKFERLLEKLRAVGPYDARPESSRKSPMPSIGPGSELTQAQIDSV